MNKTKLAVFAMIALFIGLSLPYISEYLVRLQREAGPSGYTRPPSYYRVQDGLIGFSSYGELNEFIRVLKTLNTSTRALSDFLARASARIVFAYTGELATPLPGLPVAKTPMKESPGQPSREYSTTNIQVEGVDELDIVKTNGRIIAVAAPNKVYIVNPASRSVNSVISLNETVKGIYLYLDKLVVVAEGYYTAGFAPDVDCRCIIISPGHVKQSIYVYDISSPSTPRLLTRLNATGVLVGSRLRDRYAYFILSEKLDEGIVPLVNEKPVPLETMLAVTSTPSAYTVILLVDLETLDYATYTFLTGGGAWIYMSHRFLYIAREDKPEFLNYHVLFINEASIYLPEDLKERVLSHLRQGDLYEAWNAFNNYLMSLDEKTRLDIIEKARIATEERIKHDKTTFYVFSVRDMAVDYKGSFTVDGELLDQFAMAEYGDYFIVATTVNRYALYTYELEAPPSVYVEPVESPIISIEVIDERGFRTLPLTPSRVEVQTHPRISLGIGLYIARIDDSANNVYVIDLETLRVSGRLLGLAPGERIYAGRLVKNIFYLVTFRQVDPLFAIDVSDPENPRVLGYLKIPGFSEYLHPLTSERLLGVGIEGLATLKISLFDIANPSNISEISTLLIRPGWSPVLVDHHAITVHYSRQLVFMPYSAIGGYYTDGVLVVSYKDDKLVLSKLIVHSCAQRAVYIGDELYTISYSLMKVIDLNSLEVIGEIVFS